MRINLAHTLPGRRIGRYLIQDRIGAGGMGNIFKVWDEGLKRSFALKVLPAAQALHKEAVARFQRELELLAKVQHPAIVSVVDAGTFDDAPFFVMELIEGENLEQRAARAEIDPDDAVRWMVQVARGVDHLHRRGIVHRDIKPGNILLRPDNLAVLTDFGLAQSLGHSSELTRSGLSAGTPAFMAPEQARGEAEDVGQPTDIYQLGATLFALLTGRPPQTGRTAHEIMLAIADSQGPNLTGVELDRQMRAVLNKAMARSRHARYSSASAFADDLERWLLGEWVHARGRNPVLRGLYFARRYIASVAVASAGTAIIVSALFAGSGSQTTQTVRNTYPATDPKQVTPTLNAQVGGAFPVAWRELQRREEAAKRTPLGVVVSQDANSNVGFGWGDFSATMRFRQPDLSTDAQPISCFVGSELPALSKDESAPSEDWLSAARQGLAVEYLPFESRLHVYRWGALIADVDVARALKGAPARSGIELGIQRRSGWLQVDFIPSHDQVPRTFSMMDRAMDRADSDRRSLAALQMGVLTRGDQLEVGDIEYQQSTEHGEHFEVSLWAGKLDDARVRILTRLAQRDRPPSDTQEAKLQLCLGLAMHDDPLMHARALRALDAAATADDRSTQFYASLAMLEIQVAQELDRCMQEARVFASHEDKPQVPLPTIRRLMDRDRDDVQLSEVICELQRIAEELYARAPSDFVITPNEGTNSRPIDLNQGCRVELALELLKIAADRAYQLPHHALRAKARMFAIMSEQQDEALDAREAALQEAGQTESQARKLPAIAVVARLSATLQCLHAREQAERELALSIGFRARRIELLRETLHETRLSNAPRPFLSLMGVLPALELHAPEGTWSAALKSAEDLLRLAPRYGNADPLVALEMQKLSSMIFFDRMSKGREDAAEAWREVRSFAAQAPRPDSELEAEWPQMLSYLFIDRQPGAVKFRADLAERMLKNSHELRDLPSWQRGLADARLWLQLLNAFAAEAESESIQMQHSLSAIVKDTSLAEDHWLKVFAGRRMEMIVAGGSR